MTNREQKLLPSARQLTSVRRTSNLNSLTGLPERLDFLRQGAPPGGRGGTVCCAQRRYQRYTVYVTCDFFDITTKNATSFLWKREKNACKIVIMTI